MIKLQLRTPIINLFSRFTLTSPYAILKTHACTFSYGIEAMERFQFHENEDLRTMANTLVDKYFGEDYGLDE